MSLIRAVERAFAVIAPLSLAAPWDNVGVLLEPGLASPQQRRIVLTIDLTQSVFDALPADTGCIVSYHPPLFSPINRLTQANPLQRVLLQCAARNIGVYSPHTCLDAAVGGIDYWLASAFPAANLAGMRRIRPHLTPPAEHELAGEGMLIELRQPITLEQAIQAIKQRLGISTVMVARAKRASISSIALCAGSGGSVLKDVDADLLWTGEAGHHDILAAVGSGRHVVLCNHSNTERGYLRDVLQRRLQEALAVEDTRCIVSVSEADRDPLEFV